jgi:hypothetical protein
MWAVIWPSNLAQLLCYVRRYSIGRWNDSFWQNISTASSSFDSTTHLALVCSLLIIFTTIHAQDFADVIGDQKSGRLTIPILAPEGSRIIMLGTLLIWSLFLTKLWGLGPICGSIFTLMGLQVGLRYFYLRTVRDDRLSYVFYNVSCWPRVLSRTHIKVLSCRYGSSLPISFQQTLGQVYSPGDNDSFYLYIFVTWMGIIIW